MCNRGGALIGPDKGLPQYRSVPVPAVLHNVVVLYRRAITFSYIVSTNQSRLHIPTRRFGSSNSSLTSLKASVK